MKSRNIKIIITLSMFLLMVGIVGAVTLSEKYREAGVFSDKWGTQSGFSYFDNITTSYTVVPYVSNYSILVEDMNGDDFTEMMIMDINDSTVYVIDGRDGSVIDFIQSLDPNAKQAGEGEIVDLSDMGVPKTILLPLNIGVKEYIMGVTFNGTILNHTITIPLDWLSTTHNSSYTNPVFSGGINCDYRDTTIFHDANKVCVIPFRHKNIGNNNYGGTTLGIINISCIYELNSSTCFNTVIMRGINEEVSASIQGATPSIDDWDNGYVDSAKEAFVYCDGNGDDDGDWCVVDLVVESIDSSVGSGEGYIRAGTIAHADGDQQGASSPILYNGIGNYDQMIYTYKPKGAGYTRIVMKHVLTGSVIFNYQIDSSTSAVVQPVLAEIYSAGGSGTGKPEVCAVNEQFVKCYETYGLNLEVASYDLGDPYGYFFNFAKSGTPLLSANLDNLGKDDIVFPLGIITVGDEQDDAIVVKSFPASGLNFSYGGQFPYTIADVNADGILEVIFSDGTNTIILDNNYTNSYPVWNTVDSDTGKPTCYNSTVTYAMSYLETYFDDEGDEIKTRVDCYGNDSWSAWSEFGGVQSAIYLMCNFTTIGVFDTEFEMIDRPHSADPEYYPSIVDIRTIKFSGCFDTGEGVDDDGEGVPPQSTCGTGDLFDENGLPCYPDQNNESNGYIDENGTSDYFDWSKCGNMDTNVGGILYPLCPVKQYSVDGGRRLFQFFFSRFGLILLLILIIVVAVLIAKARRQR